MAIAVAQNCKRVSISSKRQITIPQKFYKELGFVNEAECILKDGALILKPVIQENSGDFAQQILAELVAEGYTGDQLLAEFKKRRTKIRPAVIEMLNEADQVAEETAGYLTMTDVFGEV